MRFISVSTIRNNFSAIYYFRNNNTVVSKKMRPLYIKISEKWNVYLLVATGIFLNIIWYFVSAEDVEIMLTEQMVPLVLLVFLSLFVYFSVFHSLKRQLHENNLMNKNIKMQKDKDIIAISTEAMEADEYYSA